MAESRNTRGNVRVCVRFRGQSALELAEGGTPVTEHASDSDEVCTVGGCNAFTFDRIFAVDASQADVYEYAAREIVESVSRAWLHFFFPFAASLGLFLHLLGWVQTLGGDGILVLYKANLDVASPRATTPKPDVELCLWPMTYILI
ncbi:hypothetical protein T492DRAFT_866186 [Pavlovales sp. CCMP2436]|nr:hypothetical protein T492DRAFT_866186 [Pavlovales sp. CCMP2436]